MRTLCLPMTKDTLRLQGLTKLDQLVSMVMYSPLRAQKRIEWSNGWPAYCRTDETNKERRFYSQIRYLKGTLCNFFLFKIYKHYIMSEYIIDPSSKLCFVLSWITKMPIIIVYILIILDQAGRQPPAKYAHAQYLWERSSTRHLQFCLLTTRVPKSYSINLKPILLINKWICPNLFQKIGLRSDRRKYCPIKIQSPSMH